MKTMYVVTLREYLDCEGISSRYNEKAMVATMEEALIIVKTFPKHHEHTGYDTGDWQIIAKTMDEETFTITEKIVKEFNWWDKVGREENRKETIAYYEKELEKAYKIKPKTEKGAINKEARIINLKEKIEKLKKGLTFNPSRDIINT